MTAQRPSLGVMVTYIDGQRLEELLVHVAPAPVFVGLVRFYDGVVRRVVVPGGVLVLRVIAAADVSARLAQAQMHPVVPYLQAVLAAV